LLRAENALAMTAWIVTYENGILLK